MTREFGLTFRDALQDNERLVAGTFWSGPLTEATTPDGFDTEVSIEQMVNTEEHVDVGDKIRFDVGGRILRTRVTSIRKVTWDEAQNGGFVFVLRPGPAVERTPHTYVGFIEVAKTPEARGAVQRDLAKAFPNVSSIDVRDVLTSIKEVVDNVTLGVTDRGRGHAHRRHPDPRGRRGDDEVPAALRGGDLPDARREHPDDRVHGGHRVQPARRAGGADGRGGRPGPVLGAGPLAVRDRVASGARAARSPASSLRPLAVGLVGLAASADVLVRKPLATLRSE